MALRGKGVNIPITAEDKTKAAIKSAKGNLRSLDGSVKKLAGGFAVLAGASAIGAVVKGSLEAADQIGKMSDRLGIGAAELQKLQFAAEQTGVGVSTFNTALQRMVRRIEEAKSGSGVAVKALDAIGLSAQNIADLPVEEQFLRISEAMSQLEDTGIRTNAMMQIFDTEGVALAQTMMNGRESVEALGQELEDMGAVLSQSQIDTATEAQDAMNSLSRSLGGLRDIIVIGIAPALTVFADGLTFLVSKANQLLESVGLISRDTSELTNVLNSASEERLTDALIEWQEKLDAARDSTAPFREELERLEQTASLIKQGVPVEGLAETDIRYIERTAELRRLIEEMGDEATIAKENVTQLADALERLDSANSGGNNAGNNGAAKSFVEITRTLPNSREELEAWLDTYKQLFDATYGNDGILIDGMFGSKSADEYQTQLERMLNPQNLDWAEWEKSLFASPSKAYQNYIEQLQADARERISGQPSGVLEDIYGRLEREGFRQKFGAVGVESANEFYDNWKKTADMMRALGIVDVSQYDEIIQEGRDLGYQIAQEQTRAYAEYMANRQMEGPEDKTAEYQAQKRQEQLQRMQDEWRYTTEQIAGNFGSIIGGEFGNLASRSTKPLKEIANEWKYAWERIGQQIVGYFTQQVFTKLAMAATNFLLNLIAPNGGGGFGSMLSAIFGQGGGGDELSPFIARPTDALGGGGTTNVVQFQSVIPPTQADLRSAARTIGDARYARQRFIIAGA